VARFGDIDIEVGDLVHRKGEAEIGQEPEIGISAADVVEGGLADLENELTGELAIVAHEVGELVKKLASRNVSRDRFAEDADLLVALGQRRTT